jgi:hypothetical protein
VAGEIEAAAGEGVGGVGLGLLLGGGWRIYSRQFVKWATG